MASMKIGKEVETSGSGAGKRQAAIRNQHHQIQGCRPKE